MFQEPEQLSSDLEWMLQSGQAPDSPLIATLVAEYYGAILDYSLTALGDVRLAARATRHTLALAVVDSHRYPGGDSHRSWLLDLARQTCARFLGHPRPGDPAADQGCKWENAHPNGLSQDEIFSLRVEIEALVRARRHDQGRRARLKEFLLLGMAVLLVGVMLGIGHRLFGDEDRLKIRAAAGTATRERAIQATHTRLAVQGIHLTPTPVTHPPQPAPLTLNATTQSIRQSLEKNYLTWHTLWADVEIYHYSPVQPPDVPISARAQLWMSRNVGILILTGPLEGELNPPRLAADSYKRPFQEKIDTYRFFARQFPWLWQAGNPRVGENWESRPSWADSTSTFQAITLDRVAGRQTLVVDQFDDAGARVARLWLDTLTGLNLRHQFFAPSDTGTLLREAIVREIAYDVDFPAGIFEWVRDPQKLRRFAADYRGEPESID